MNGINILFIYFTSVFWSFMMCDCSSQSMDLQTPRNVYLTAFYKRSFAHHTVKNRMPVIVTQIIDGLARSKEQIGKEYGEQAQEELKGIIGELSKLKYEIQTNKSLRNLTSSAPDIKFYNDYITALENKEGQVNFFSTIWLLAECYMYRRIRETFELTTKLRNYDPFAKQKQDAYFQALPAIQKLGQRLVTILHENPKPDKDEFITLLKLNLWGNKCDLSLSNGVVEANHDQLFNIDELQPYLLCDDSEKVWKIVSETYTDPDVIDIIFDNSGLEVFTDLCLADYLISKNLTKKIRFYVKAIPWFISDVMLSDFHWLLNQLKTHTDDNLRKLGQKWVNYISDNTWVLIEHRFWTLPVDFSVMAKVDINLYKKLAEARLVIFKGDLNYRKLFGEKNWDPTTPIDEALQGFNPTNICTLRTIKADIVCGLAPGVAEKSESENPKWMETGEYGLIQVSNKIVRVD